MLWHWPLRAAPPFLGCGAGVFQVSVQSSGPTSLPPAPVFPGLDLVFEMRGNDKAYFCSLERTPSVESRIGTEKVPGLKTCPRRK